MKTFNEKIGVDGKKRVSYSCVVILKVKEKQKMLITAYPVGGDYMPKLMLATL